MDLSRIVVNQESFDTALHYLEVHKGIRLGKVQKKFIARCKECPESKRIVVSQGKESYLIIGDESEYLIPIQYPARMEKLYAIAVLFVVICVSQPNRNCAIINTVSRTMAQEFIEDVCNLLEFFKDSKEFTWSLSMKDIRKAIGIKTEKYGYLNHIKACKGDKDNLKANYFYVELVI